MLKILSNGYQNREVLDPDPLSKFVLVNRCTEVRNKYTLPWVHSICYSCESTCYSIRVVCWNSFCLITLMIHVLFWTLANYLPMPHSFLESSFQTRVQAKTKFWKWHRWSFRTADCFFFIIIELIGEDGRLLFFLEQIGEDSRLLITLLTEVKSLKHLVPYLFNANLSVPKEKKHKHAHVQIMILFSAIFTSERAGKQRLLFDRNMVD